MHEYLVVDCLVSNVSNILSENNSSKVDKVEKIFVGMVERSNIDKSLLNSAFANFKLEWLRDCEIEIRSQDIMLECRSCFFRFHSLDNTTCPSCKSKDTQIIDGRDIRLESVSLLVE